jgi:hypothetical protein
MSVSTRVLITLGPPYPAPGTDVRRELLELIGERGLVGEPAHGRDLRPWRRRDRRDLAENRCDVAENR